jgi:hypothetical protein
MLLVLEALRKGADCMIFYDQEAGSKIRCHGRIAGADSSNSAQCVVADLLVSIS